MRANLDPSWKWSQILSYSVSATPHERIWNYFHSRHNRKLVQEMVANRFAWCAETDHERICHHFHSRHNRKRMRASLGPSWERVQFFFIYGVWQPTV